VYICHIDKLEGSYGPDLQKQARIELGLPSARANDVFNVPTNYQNVKVTRYRRGTIATF